MRTPNFLKTKLTPTRLPKESAQASLLPGLAAGKLSPGALGKPLRPPPQYFTATWRHSRSICGLLAARNRRPDPLTSVMENLAEEKKNPRQGRTLKCGANVAAALGVGGTDHYLRPARPERRQWSKHSAKFVGDRPVGGR